MKAKKKEDRGKVRESIKKKSEEVERIAEKCKEYSLLALSNIEGIPAKRFQEIRKKLDNVFIKIAKKSLIERIFEKLGLDINEAKEIISKPSCLLLAKLNPFSFAALLEENKLDSFVKPGQILAKDLVIPPQQTNLLPTDIVNLTQAGFKAAVEKGKLVIKEQKIIKAGEKIDESLANALQKLNIKPIRVGLNVNYCFDFQSKKVYKNIVINKEEEKEKLAIAWKKALALALGIKYACKVTIRELIKRAYLNANTLNNLKK
ncbi:MAG: 50S ribosomal protein L10 [Candidatus Pacearchaeota archaeon]